MCQGESFGDSVLVGSCRRQTEETYRQQKVGVDLGFFAVAKEGNDRDFCSVSISHGH